MACVYTLKGREYSEKEFKSLLADHLVGEEHSIDALLNKINPPKSIFKPTDNIALNTEYLGKNIGNILIKKDDGIYYKVRGEEVKIPNQKKAQQAFIDAKKIESEVANMTDAEVQKEIDDFYKANPELAPKHTYPKSEQPIKEEKNIPEKKVEEKTQTEKHNDLTKAIKKYNDIPKKERGTVGANLRKQIDAQAKELGYSFRVKANGDLQGVNKAGKILREIKPKNTPEQIADNKAIVEDLKRAKKGEPTSIGHFALQYVLSGGKITLDDWIRFGGTDPKESGLGWFIDKENNKDNGFDRIHQGMEGNIENSHILQSDGKELGDAMVGELNSYVNKQAMEQALLDHYKDANEIFNHHKFAPENLEPQYLDQADDIVDAYTDVEVKKHLQDLENNRPSDEILIEAQLKSEDYEKQKNELNKNDGQRKTETPLGDNVAEERQKEKYGKEVDDKIADVDKQLSEAKKEREQKRNSLNKSVTLFDEGKKTNELLAVEKKQTPEVLKEALKPFDDKIAKLEKEKSDLEKGRDKYVNDKIDADKKQLKLGEEPPTVTPKNETVTPPEAPKEIVEPPKKEISEGAKKIADKIRGLKTKEITFKDKDGNEIPITKKGVGWNDIVEGIAKKVEETGDIIQAIHDYLNEQDWYKGLSKEDKKAVEEQVKGNLDEEGIVTGIAHRQTDAAARRLGLPEYEKNPETFAQWDEQAQTRIENGEMPDLIKKMQDGDMPSAVEQRMMAKYAADLLAKIEKNPTNELINQYADFKKLADIVGGREVGKSLAARKGLQPVIENVADMYVAKMEASGVEVLTEAQKKYVEKIKAEYDELNAKADALLKEAKEKIAKLEAGKELNKLKGERKATKKTHADYQKERADLIQKFKDAGKSKPDAPKQSGAPINDEQVKIVLQLAKSFVDEAIDVTKVKLGEVVDKISEAVGLDKDIIHNVLAGDYSKKQSKTELQMKMADLREEAKLTNKLNALQRGEEPKTEKAKVERNQQIKELRDKIKGFRKEKENAEQEPEIKKDPNVVALEKIISRNEKKIKELQDKIDKGDFEKKKAPSVLEDNRLKENYPDLWKKTMDALKKAEDKAHEFDIELYKDEQARRSLGKKAIDLGADTIGTMKAIKAGIDDSALLIQNIVALSSHPSVIPHVVAGHLTDLWSQKNYDRWLTNLHNSPSWDLIRNSGLDVTEPKSLSAEKKEETYDRNLLNKTFRVKGKEYSIGKYTTKPFERMFTSLSNRTRVGVFLRIAQKYYNEGMTFETHPKEFESLAKLLNTETGRGDLHPKLQKIQGLLSAGIWSPKLMASRLSLLGMSDAVNPLTGEKGFYKSLTPRARKQAAKDMAQFIGTGLAVMALFALNGYEPDLDPTSVTFGSVGKDGKRYNFFGGFTQYVRLAAQMITGKQTVEGVTTKQPIEKSAMMPLHFLRGKTTPILGAYINWKLGKDYIGHPTTLGKEALGLVTPLSMNGLLEGLKQEGVSSLLTSELPALTGINVSYESDFNREVPKEISHNGTKEELSDSQHEELQKLYDEKYPTFLNTLVNTEMYKKASDEEKYTLRQSASTLALNESEKEIKKKYPQQFVKESKEQVDERFKKDLDLWKYKKSLGLKDIGNMPQRSNYKQANPSTLKIYTP